MAVLLNPGAAAVVNDIHYCSLSALHYYIVLVRFQIFEERLMCTQYVWHSNQVRAKMLHQQIFFSGGGGGDGGGGGGVLY